jgi:hypothetical protein
VNRYDVLLPSSLLGTRSVIPTTSAAPVDHHDRGYTLGDPGQPAQIPTLLIMVFDDSGSVTGSGGNDPLSNRYAEAQHAFEVVARRGSRRELGAVLHFDQSTADTGPIPLTWWGLLLLRPGLRVPSGGGRSSELAPSLAGAVNLARSHPRHAVTLVVLSDFELLDADPEQVLAHLVAFPGDVHAIVLGSGLFDFHAGERITVTHIGRADRPGAVAQAVFTSLTKHRESS